MTLLEDLQTMRFLDNRIYGSCEMALRYQNKQIIYQNHVTFLFITLVLNMYI